MSICMDNVLLQANIILSQGSGADQRVKGHEICVNVNGNHGDVVACTHKKSHFRSSEIHYVTVKTTYSFKRTISDCSIRVID